MQKLVIFALTGAALVGLHRADAASAIYLDFGTNKSCLQTASFVQGFTAGDFTIHFNDGTYTISPCDGNDGPALEQPNDFCSLGTTGFIASGDLDHDGIRDDASFWSISAIVGNALIEAYRPELVLLNAAPNSPLPRPIGNFSDSGVTIFYNLFGDIYQYDRTVYDFTRTYAPGVGNLVEMNRELPTGQYQFVFPLKGNPLQKYPITCPLTPFVEPFIATSQGRNGFRFTNTHWNSGALEVDPRLINAITWSGNNTTNVRPATDALFFSITTPNPALSFPPATGTRVRQVSPLGTTTSLPPYFFQVGDDGVMHVDFERNSGAVVIDNSTRHFDAPIRFIDTYAGFAQLAFPVGTKAALIKPTADYDGDGFTNIVEYAYQSDVTNTDGAVDDDPILAGTFDVNPPATTAIRTITITKRPNTGLSLTYGVQTSTNGGRSFKVEKLAAPKWTVITDDTTTLQVQSTAAIPASTVIHPYAKANY